MAFQWAKYNERETMGLQSWSEVHAAAADRAEWRHSVETLYVMRYQTDK